MELGRQRQGAAQAGPTGTAAATAESPEDSPTSASCTLLKPKHQNWNLRLVRRRRLQVGMAAATGQAR